MDSYGPRGVYSWDKAAFRNNPTNKGVDTWSTALGVSAKPVFKLGGSTSREVAHHRVTFFTKRQKYVLGASLSCLIWHLCLQSSGLTMTASLFCHLNLVIKAPRMY